MHANPHTDSAWQRDNGRKSLRIRQEETFRSWKSAITSVLTGSTCFQMAGNPDQQEDALDDQYQEEVEDEVAYIQTHLLYCRNKV